MTDTQKTDVIIIGGSYAGLSAGMALGRALRKVLIIDGGEPCNRQTPHSHNFITQDGQTPKAISTLARNQVEKYETVQFYEGLAVQVNRTNQGFDVETKTGELFTAKKLILASGIKDLLPPIEGFAACWGISVIHCPYCHGYEVRNEKTAVLTNGELGYDFSKMISNWTKDLILFTNGPSTFTEEQNLKLKKKGIGIIETEIDKFVHHNGQLEQVIFKDGSKIPLKVLYAKLPFTQQAGPSLQAGCELTEQGYIKTDGFQKTTIPGLYACGDNTWPMRSVSNAVAEGTLTGAMVNRELIEEEF